MPDDPNKPKGDINWDEIWQKITGKKDDISKEWKPKIYIAVGVVVVIWLLTGIYTVGTGEEGVVKRFGEHQRTDSPGLNYHLPWPFESKTIVNVQEIRITEIGYRTSDKGDTRDVLEESQMLTGDRNIVDADLAVQWKIRDSGDYLFNVQDPERTLQAATEVVLRGVVGQSGIDQVLTEGRTEVNTRTLEGLQQELDRVNSGIEVVLVALQETAPPTEVKDAFDEVNRAEQDRERLTREAEGYAADKVPRARGDAEKIVLAAAAYRDQRVLQAEGDATKFLKILKEHEVPAAFEVLAEAGVNEANEVLLQIGGIAEQTSVEDILTDADISEELLEENAQAPGMTRSTLTDILVSLGAVPQNQNPEALTGQVLRNALDQLNLLDEYDTAYAGAIRLTRERLYLETLEDTLPETEIVVVDPQAGGNLMPFLPLKDLTTIEAGESEGVNK